MPTTPVNVKGVTTAASLWVSGALGAACGMGAYVLAAVAAGLALVILTVIGRLEPRDQKPVEANGEPHTGQPSKVIARNPPAV